MNVEKERRSSGQRLPVQTLVDVGTDGDGTAFEAESVNLTTAGMHLKTAYLPELGETLICRFEGDGGEVVVRGEVVWRDETSYGGDFGLRFIELDDENLKALQDLVGQQAADEQGDDSDQAKRGMRMRLHIDGLGSPMKARVRESTESELMVGSNLEFLRVGRHVDLENVDTLTNQGARIERVSIEVDPASQIPQLIVALRYLDAPDGKETVGRQAKGAVSDDSEVECELDEGDEAYDDEDDDRKRALWSRFKEVGPKLAIVGDKAKSFGERAKQVVTDAVDKAKAKATTKAKDKSAKGDKPLRKTSPIPKSKRSVTKSTEDVAEPLTGKPKLPKRAAMIALIGVLITIVAIGFAKKPWGKGEVSEDSTAEAAAQPAQETDPTAQMGQLAELPLGGMVANVPLFGPTPMTSTPQIAPAALAAAPATATPPPDDGKQGAAEEETDEEDTADNGALAKQSDDADSDEEDQADDAADEPSSKASKSSKKSKKNLVFSRGKVRNPQVFTFKMSHTIRSIDGAVTGNGFQVKVVGARSKQPASTIKKHDSRVATAKMVNSGKNTVLTVDFRKDVPSFRVRANGSKLEVVIDQGKRTAKANTKKPSRKK